VGGTSIENTHPFAQGRWIFAHNGTVPAFLKVRDRMMPHLDPTFAADIHGTTDSEHVFQFLMSLRLRHPEMTLREVVARGVNAVRGWAREAAPDKRLGLNIVMTDGRSLVGTRLGRTLWQLRRTEITPCPICGRSHVHHAAGMTYRAVEVASEPITDDAWQEVPDGSVFSVEEDYALVCEPLDSHGGLPPAPSRAPVSRI